MSDKELLLEEAKTFVQPSTSVAKEFSSKREDLASALNRAMLARPDLDKLVGGADNHEMMQNNHRNHYRYMESVFQHYDPATFVETILWVLRAYRSHGFRLAYWPAMLDIGLDNMKGELSPDAYAAVEPFFRWMLVNMPRFVRLSDETFSAWEPGQEPSHG